MAEGCSENIMRKYLVDFLKCIDAGIQHPVPAVRNAALYALGQFSEYLQVGECSLYLFSSCVSRAIYYATLKVVGLLDHSKLHLV